MLSRQGRVHIKSEHGMAWDTQVVLQDDQEPVLRVAKATITMKPGEPLMAHLDCYLPSLDILSEAQIVQHSAAMLHREHLLQACARELVKLPASPELADLLTQIHQCCMEPVQEQEPDSLTG